MVLITKGPPCPFFGLDREGLQFLCETFKILFRRQVRLRRRDTRRLKHPKSDTVKLPLLGGKLLRSLTRFMRNNQLSSSSIGGTSFFSLRLEDQYRYQERNHTDSTKI